MLGWMSLTLKVSGLGTLETMGTREAAVRTRREGFELTTDQATSLRLGRVRRSGTEPELIVRRLVRGLGHRYRISNRALPGSPDLANRRRGWVIFVHGCYWHRHQDCSKATTPKNNRAFWLAKFERNVARDRRVSRELRRAGLRVIVIWECETKDERRLERKLARRLGEV